MSQYSHWSPGQQHPHGVFQTPSQPQSVIPSAQNDLDEPFGYSNDQQAIFESTVAHGPARNSSDKDADKLLFKLTKLELMLQKQMDLGVQSSKPSMPDPLANYAPGLVKQTILAPTQAIRQVDSDRTSAMKMLEKERPEWGLVRRIYIRHGAVYFVYKNINDAMTFQPDPDSMARALGTDVTTFEYFPETYYVEIIFHGKRIHRDVQNSVNYEPMFEAYDIKFGTSNKCMMKGSRFILQLGDKETAWRLLSAYESEMDDFQVDYCRADVRAIDIRSKCLGFAGLEPRWASDKRKEEAAKNSPAGESSAAEGSASSPIDLFSDSVSHASSDKCKGKAPESFAASVEPMDLHPGGRPVASGIGHSSRKTKGKATAADRNITPHKGGAKRARFSHSNHFLTIPIVAQFRPLFLGRSCIFSSSRAENSHADFCVICRFSYISQDFWHEDCQHRQHTSHLSVQH
ncbi:hypothetical protein K4K61_005862 [Colletotrichum sp. SAR11_59]|nr:hypothetical protein K4K61_005862 [Colletotrichum sp. SAR11_59]